MAFQNLPNDRVISGLYNQNNKTGEAQEYYTLYMLKDRSNTGEYHFTSTSSGVTYSTNDHPTDVNVYNKGQEGMIAYLITYVLQNYIISATNLTALENTVTDTVLPALETLGNGVSSNSLRITSAEDSIDTIERNATKTFNITLDSASWTQSGETESYYQNITAQISSYLPATTLTKVDLQPNSELILQMIDDGVGGLLVANESPDNSNLLFKAYAVGAAPTVNMVVQATKTEVNSVV